MVMLCKTNQALSISTIYPQWMNLVRSLSSLGLKTKPGSKNKTLFVLSKTILVLKSKNEISVDQSIKTRKSCRLIYTRTWSSDKLNKMERYSRLALNSAQNTKVQIHLWKMNHLLATIWKLSFKAAIWTLEERNQNVLIHTKISKASQAKLQLSQSLTLKIKVLMLFGQEHLKMHTR